MTSPTTSKRVLVTGATGFLGHHLCSALVDAGYEVVALCRDPDSSLAQRLPEVVTRVRGDLRAGESIREAAQGCSGLFNCAGMVSRDSEDAVRMWEVNAAAVEPLLDTCKEAGVTRVVHASTSGTIGISSDADFVADEDSPTPIELVNRWPYYRSKYYGEQAALTRNAEGFEVVVVNPSLLLGPGDEHGSSTEDVRRALEGRIPFSPAGGISFVDARDAAEAMIRAYEDGQAGARYLLTSCNCSLRTFFDRIARVAGTPPPHFAMPDSKLARVGTLWLMDRAAKWLGEDEEIPDRETIDMAQHYWYVDATKAENELKWTSRDPMVTLADTVEDLRERGVVMMFAPEA